MTILASTYLSNATVEIAHSAAEINIPVNIQQWCVHQLKMGNAMYIVMMVTMPANTLTLHAQVGEIVYSSLGDDIVGILGLELELVLHVKKTAFALSSVQELIAIVTMVTSVLIPASLAQEKMVNALWSVVVIELANLPILLGLQ